MHIIDLTHPISPDMPVYPGTEPPVFILSCTIKTDGFEERQITLFSHTGTHLDAPSHIFPGGKTLDQLPVGHFSGRGVVLDISADGKSTVGQDDLEPYREIVSASDFVLLCTGWSRLWGRDEYFVGFPVLSPAAAEWIAQFPLKGLGVDAISVDAVGSTAFPVHKTLLQKDIVVIENLTNLKKLLDRQFQFHCFPLKITDGDGSPVRAVAILE
ncbi:MAG: cyclase family protein [Eubacteriales bacterium]|nr:cyclase family protein [Bacillota bacterium]MBV1728554.1 cyclase family protein [Desulforudis sp.]MDP3050920.1 cyclase family protein [Eubacteriales bacterium]MDQ7789180.1 cyclase family protein [Clostridia bacterium]MBU4553997.1 cyclase family protein [Bacillota bacterium]